MVHEAAKSQKMTKNFRKNLKTANFIRKLVKGVTLKS